MANNNFIYDIVNDAKKVLILNLELEKITEISYNDAYDKVFFNTNEVNLILRSGISPYFLKILMTNNIKNQYTIVSQIYELI